MGDTSESSSSVSSIDSTPDDISRDPTFTCKVKIDPPKVIRKSSRFIKSIADLGTGSLFTVESKDNQSNTKTKKKSKAVPSQIVKKSNNKMPFECKNDWTGDCGTDRGCYCFCKNGKEGDCDAKCVCLDWGMGEINIGPDSIPSLLTGDMGLSSKMGLSDSVRRKGSAIDDPGSKTGLGGVKGAGASGHGHIRVPDADNEMQDIANEIKSAMMDVSQSMRQVGRTARQNNTSFISEIPYFGVPPETYKNKSIIPLNEPRRFLDTIDTLTDTEDFNEAGKIAVLKSRLLGPAQEYFTDYDGGADWLLAKQYLLEMYPEVISYPTVKDNIQKMKRECGEQISNYATRVRKAYNTLQRVHPSRGYSDATKQSDSIIKLLEILPESDRLWIRTENADVNTFSNVLQQILIYVEKRTNLKLSMEAIQKESSSKPGTIEVNQVVDTSGGKPPDKSGKNQTGKAFGGQGFKQGDKTVGKACYHCKKVGHVISQCRKKKFEEWLKSQPKSGSNVSQSSQPNNSNFKYNLGYSQVRCTHCGKNGHSVDICRHRLNAMATASTAEGLVFDKNASSGQGLGQNIQCRYCKGMGHMKDTCQKLAYKNANKVASGQQGSSAYIRKCYVCDDTSHLARSCPKKSQNF